MGVRFASAWTTTPAGTLPAGATDTAIAVLAPINTALDNAMIMLLWMACITPGAGTTALNFRIHRGPTTSYSMIGAANWGQTVTPANNYICSGCYVDSPPAIAEEIYTLSVIQTAATAAGTINDLCFMAFTF